MDVIITSITSMFTTFLPALLTALVTSVETLFFVTSETGVITGLTAIGMITIVAIGIPMCFGLFKLARRLISLRRS